MIELKRLKLINWHNFENVTFDCARLTYMIGVNAVGKTTILDAIRYCLTTNRSFNALGNKKSGRTLQGSVHAKQRGENAYRRPGRTVAYIGIEFWDTVKRTSFVIAVRVESEGPMQELHPGDQTWYISEDGITLEQLPFIDPRTGAPSAKEDFKPAEGRLSYTRSPSEARDRICRALGIGVGGAGLHIDRVDQIGAVLGGSFIGGDFLHRRSAAFGGDAAGLAFTGSGAAAARQQGGAKCQGNGGFFHTVLFHSLRFLS